MRQHYCRILRFEATPQKGKGEANPFLLAIKYIFSLKKREGRSHSLFESQTCLKTFWNEKIPTIMRQHYCWILRFEAPPKRERRSQPLFDK